MKLFCNKTALKYLLFSFLVTEGFLSSSCELWKAIEKLHFFSMSPSQ